MELLNSETEMGLYLNDNHEAVEHMEKRNGDRLTTMPHM